MSKEPLVSIIVNCFNGEKYLHKSLDSIISQTYKNWEIIFWDNQSTDKSSEIFKKYKDSRFKYYLASKHEKFLYKARNLAIQKAKGDFMALLDVDDWWLPNKLERQIPLFNNSNIGLVYGNLWYQIEKKNKKKILKKDILPTGKILSELLDDYVIRTATMVVRKKCLESLKYKFNDNFHIMGDYDLNLRIASQWEIGCIQDPVAFVRIHGQNETIKKKEKYIDEFKMWYNQMKNDKIISSNKNFQNIPKKINYIETMHYLFNDVFSKNFLKVAKYPLSLDKIKLIFALFLPKFIIRMIRGY